MEGISKKMVLNMTAPTEEDSRSSQRRILDALKEKGVKARIPVDILRRLYPLCEEAAWKVTASLAWEGTGWVMVDLEPGDTAKRHYGIALDLGSTTVAARLLDCSTGSCLGEASVYNHQIAFGTDILSRIFYSKNSRGKLEELRQATLTSIVEVLKGLEKKTGVSSEECIQMVIAGNTTMIHFLIGMDAFCVFSTPYAVMADAPGFLPAADLGIPIRGYVFCYPGKSNYLGGDIISGMVATGLYNREEICIFFDIGTNGELVLGNREFLLCGAGAAGPALEGGVVHTGMRASEGAVDRVWMEKGGLCCHVIGEGKGEGICGSGIVDLLAELFINGWVDIRGVLLPEKSPAIYKREGIYGVEYVPGLFFGQDDIDEFIRTKAAAHTMVEIMLEESGVEIDSVAAFYVAGAFGKHVSKESAVTIGMYPDIEREKIIHAGNTSLVGAEMLLLNKEILKDLEKILEEMVYVQFGAVDTFLDRMTAAQALPHTNLEQYPSVRQRMEERTEKH